MNLRTVVDMYLASQFFFAIAWFVIYFNSSLLIRFWAGSYVFSSNQVGLKMKNCPSFFAQFYQLAFSKLLILRFFGTNILTILS